MKLRIEKAIYGGAGLARTEGKAVFVPFALPGELVEAHITEDKRGYSTAELDSVIEPGAARVAPPCVYFGACGGCHYQHAEYAAQVATKASILRETLERARIREVPEIATIAAEPLGYRNRIRLHVERDPFRLAYRRRNSHRNLPVDGCPIAAPLLQRALAILNRDGQAMGLGEWVREIELFANGDDSAMLISLWTERSADETGRAVATIWPPIRDALPGTAGLAVFSLEKGRRVPRLLAHAGALSLAYSCGERTYRVSAGSFFQVNRWLIEPLVQLVTSGERGRSAWDLYAGVGLFSASLAAGFASVTAVESSSGSVRDLHENLRGATHRIVAAETAAFLREAAKRQAAAPDLAVVDPPRDGLGSEVTSLLGKVRPPRITYVSCDPATLSRDLAALLESGYRLAQMHLVDLFPQTFHLESVTHLTLG